MLQTGMFHMKHTAERGWRGSSRGLGEASGGLGGPTAGLNGPRSTHLAALALICGIALTGCSSPAEIAASTGVTQPAEPAVPVPPAAAGAGTVNFADNATKDQASREFSYIWPAEVAAVPALVARFTAERDRLLAEQKAEWNAAIAEFAGQDCVACTNRAYQQTWEVVADLPRFLSLSASYYADGGGAHGNGGFDALVWDREAKIALDPQAMFRSPSALQQALGAPWCKALKAEKKDRLGADYYEDDEVFPCPTIAELTLLPGSSNKQTFDRIGLLAAQYVAGSYAEGPYEVTMPVTPAVLAAVKPEYKAAFALAK